MSPEAFRSDKYLRASGYNFYVWAVVNVLVTLPLFSALDGRPWPDLLGLVYPIGLIGGGIFLAVLNDNRVQKMCGDPAPEPAVEAGRLWGPVFLLGILMTAVFVVRGPMAYIQPLWLLLVGGTYWQWGNFTIREFRLLGLVLMIAGAASALSMQPDQIPPGLASRTALVVWVIFMGVLWIPFGAYINRRYVHRL